VTYLIFGVKSFQFHVPRAGRDARLSISKIQPGWAKPKRRAAEYAFWRALNGEMSKSISTRLRQLA
jgi:hypothetical protein